MKVFEGPLIRFGGKYKAKPQYQQQKHWRGAFISKDDVISKAETKKKTQEKKTETKNQTRQQ